MDADFEHTPQHIRALFQSAIDEARRRSAANVGAEHLMLALTLDPGSTAAGILNDAGLDHDGWDRALDVEFERSLAVLGIENLDPDLLAVTGTRPRPGWGSSARDTFQRAQFSGPRGRNQSDGAALEILYGAVTASFGTVPRALEYAGVDRDALIGRVQRERIARQAGAHQNPHGHEEQQARREGQRRAQELRREMQQQAQDMRREAQQQAMELRREMQRKAQQIRRDAQRAARGRPTTDG